MSDIDSSFERIIQPGHDAIFPEYQLHLDRRQASVLEIFCRFEKAYQSPSGQDASGYYETYTSREASSRYSWEVLFQPALGSLAVGAYNSARDLKFNVRFTVDQNTGYRRLFVTRPTSLFGVQGPQNKVALSAEPHSAPKWSLRVARKAGSLLALPHKYHPSVEDTMLGL